MRGEVDFATSLRSRVQALAGVPVSAFARVLARIEPTPGVRELIAAVHARGGRVGVVSGGFHEILDTIAPELGVDVWRANRLAVSDGVADRLRRRRDRRCRGQGRGAARVGARGRRAAAPHDRDRRRRERSAHDGGRRARPRVQREARGARRRPTSWSGPSTSPRSSRCCPDRRNPARMSDAVGSVAGMDIILIPGLWLDASSWDAVTPRSKRPATRSTPSPCPGVGAPAPESVRHRHRRLGRRRRRRDRRGRRARRRRRPQRRRQRRVGRRRRAPRPRGARRLRRHGAAAERQRHLRVRGRRRRDPVPRLGLRSTSPRSSTSTSARARSGAARARIGAARRCRPTRSC